MDKDVEKLAQVFEQCSNALNDLETALLPLWRKSPRLFPKRPEELSVSQKMEVAHSLLELLTD